MPKDNFTLPTGENVTLIYGAKHPGKGTTYLNAVRMGSAIDKLPTMADEYRGMAPTYAQQLAAQVRCEVPHFDAVVSPPSSRSDAETYRKAVLHDSKARDLPNFSRRGKVKVGHNDTTLDQAVDELVYTADGRESGIKSLLIVDESIASGKTVSAVLHHMRKAGLPGDAKVTVVAWANLAPKVSVG